MGHWLKEKGRNTWTQRNGSIQYWLKKRRRKVKVVLTAFYQFLLVVSINLINTTLE